MVYAKVPQKIAGCFFGLFYNFCCFFAELDIFHHREGLPWQDISSLDKLSFFIPLLKSYPAFSFVANYHKWQKLS